MSEEQERWRQMVVDLNQLFTIEYIAQEIGVSPRQVSNIKNGDRPKGFVAIKLHLFHDKHRTRVHSVGTPVHGAEVK